MPPGTRQLVIQYELLTGEGGADIDLDLPYPTAQVTILAGPGLDSVQINSPQLAALPPATDIPGGPFAHWGSDVLSAGDTLSFRLGPQAPTLTVAQWSLLGLAFGLLASAIVSLWGGRPTAVPGERGRLVAAVARLDDAHEGGDLADADYHARRGDLVGRLMEIDDTGPEPSDAGG